MLTRLKYDKAKGMTLVEIVVVIVILGMVAVVAGKFFMIYLEMNRENAKVQLSTDAKTVLEKIVDEVRRCSDTDIYTEGGVKITDDSSLGTIIQCVDDSGTSTWFKLSEDVDSDKLVRFKSDSSNPYTPGNPDPADAYQLSANVTDFEVKIVSESDNVILYDIKLGLSTGHGKNKIEVLVDTQVKKYQKP